jgi:hypothetical protein
MDAQRIRRLTSAAELKAAALEHNWDDGFAVPRAIAFHPRCDLAVALQLFWLADAMAVYVGEAKEDGYNEDWLSFCRPLIEKILRGDYGQGDASFDPTLDRVQLYKYSKRGVPEIFLSPVAASHA